VQIPKAKSFKPDEFIDSTIVRQLEQSGFIKNLYR
jgi:hypothetical protein